jgi:hypothetical protein
VSQQPTLENDSKEFERAIKKGKISGKVIALQTKASFKLLMNNIGFNAPYRRFLLNTLYTTCKKDGSHESSNNLAKENKLLLPISRRSPPFYNVVTIVEISAKTTLKTLHKQLNSTIKKELNMRPFVFMRPDGNRIPAMEDHNYNAKEFLPVCVIREQTEEEEKADNEKMVALRKELIRQRENFHWKIAEWKVRDDD